MLKLEHLGFAVKNLADADQMYSRLFGTSPYKHETVESEFVTTSFFKIGDVKVELLEDPLDRAWYGAKDWVQNSSFSTWSISKDEWEASGKRKAKE